MRGASVLLLLLVASACSARRVPHSAPAAAAPVAPAAEPPAWRFLREKYDDDGDGRLTRAEYGRSDEGFRRLDADENELVTVADFDAQWDGVARNGGAEFVWGEGGPELGDPAPDFDLPTTGGERIALASFRGKKPVVLVFGSFT